MINIGSIEVTKRELLVSIIIVLLMIGLGFILSTWIHNKTMIDNEKYFKALKINDDKELFQHAINTNVGNVVSYGKFIANEPVSDPLINGEYFSIKKIEEHYVMKTRTVTYTDSNGNTKTRTETYWEWDVVKKERFDSKTFTYLGQVFDYEIVKIENHSHLDTVKTERRVRFKFYVIPKEFEASLYSNVKSNTIEKNNIYPNQTIDELMEHKENEADLSVKIFWVFWTILIMVTVVAFVALDNKFINGK